MCGRITSGVRTRDGLHATAAAMSLCIGRGRARRRRLQRSIAFTAAAAPARTSRAMRCARRMAPARVPWRSCWRWSATSQHHSKAAARRSRNALRGANSCASSRGRGPAAHRCAPPRSAAVRHSAGRPPAPTRPIATSRCGSRRARRRRAAIDAYPEESSSRRSSRGSGRPQGVAGRCTCARVRARSRASCGIDARRQEQRGLVGAVEGDGGEVTGDFDENLLGGHGLCTTRRAARRGLRRAGGVSHSIRSASSSADGLREQTGEERTVLVGLPLLCRALGGRAKRRPVLAGRTGSSVPVWPGLAPASLARLASGRMTGNACITDHFRFRATPAARDNPHVAGALPIARGARRLYGEQP